MAYIDVVNPDGDLVQSGMGLRFPRKKTAAEILPKLEKFGVGLLVKEDGTVIDDDEDVDSPCVYRLIPLQCSYTTSFNPSTTSNITELPGPVEEVLRSVEVALKRHTQLMETLIRTGVKIASHSSPGGSEDGRCDSQGGPRRSPESSSAAEEHAAGTSSGTSKL